MLSKKSYIALISIFVALVSVVLPPYLATAQTKSVKYVKIKPGDTLWKFSRRYKVNVDLIAAANGIDRSTPIVAGEKLKMPSRYVTYKIKEGDSLWGLANKYSLSLQNLLKANNLKEEDTLEIGRKIIIPVTTDKVSDAAISTMSAPGFPEGFFRWPVYGIITSVFGPRDGKMHEGIDIAKDQGDLIRAARRGKVAFTGWRGGYGKAVILNHGNGVRTLYGHASKILVNTGEEVYKGQPIARIGSTGRSTGPHLHFEILYKGNPLNPRDFLPKN